MMINIGDTVQITNSEFKMSYERIIGCVGVVKDIKASYDPVSNEHRRTYYVSIDGIFNEYQDDGLFCFNRESSLQHLQWQCYYTTEPKEPKITFKKENKTMEILELYHDIKRGDICAKHKKEIERLKNSIPEIKRVKEFFATMRDVKGLRLAFEYEWDKQPLYMEQLNKLNEKYDKKLTEVDEEFLEIRTMLSECETYEQKQNILKAYGVVDEQGKLRK